MRSILPLLILATMLTGCATLEIITYRKLSCRYLVLAWMEAEHEDGVADATQFWYTTDEGEEHAVGAKGGEYYAVWLYKGRLLDNKVKLSLSEIASGTHHMDYPHVTARRVLSGMRYD